LGKDNVKRKKNARKKKNASFRKKIGVKSHRNKNPKGEGGIQEKRRGGGVMKKLLEGKTEHKKIRDKNPFVKKKKL